MSDSQVDGGYGVMNRKKRRGMIEKRRRDRINNSLHELKRLVPAAFEKQGSAKLEKAEILQLTVDHLRTLHSKGKIMFYDLIYILNLPYSVFLGFDAFSFDPQKFATDYHIIGFRECAAEMARYLVAVEGLDLQDPMRLRLINHLQNYATQRELSLKSNTGWNPSLFTTPMYPSNGTQQSAQSPQQQASSNHSASVNASNTSNTSQTSAVNNCDSMSLHSLAPATHHGNYSVNSYASYPSQQPQHLDSSMISSSTGSSSAMSCNGSKSSSSVASPFAMNGSSSPYSSVSSSNHAQASAIPHSAIAPSYSYSYHAPGTYFPSTAAYMPPMMPTTPIINNNNNNNPSSNGQNSVKPYRPWGTELTTY